MFKLGDKSRFELNQPGAKVHPALVLRVERAIELTPVDFSVHDGIRTLDEQREYVRSGVSKTMKSYHLPRETPEGKFGCAVDLVPYINGKLRWEWEPIYQIIGAMHQADEEELSLFQKVNPQHRLRWGAVWDKYLDELDPHNLERERANYRERRRKQGRKAFSDGPHIQIEFV